MLIYFEFRIRELVMNNASESSRVIHSRPAGDRIRAGQMVVPGEGLVSPPVLNVKQ